MFLIGSRWNWKHRRSIRNSWRKKSSCESFSILKADEDGPLNAEATYPCCDKPVRKLSKMWSQVLLSDAKWSVRNFTPVLGLYPEEEENPMLFSKGLSQDPMLFSMNSWVILCSFPRTAVWDHMLFTKNSCQILCSFPRTAARSYALFQDQPSDPMCSLPLSIPSSDPKDSLAFSILPKSNMREATEQRKMENTG